MSPKNLQNLRKQLIIFISAKEGFVQIYLCCMMILILGHIGHWCRKNTNPAIEMKKVGMDLSANTPVCEQFFSWFNKYRNLKAMGEAHYKLFILYVIDLHNNFIEGRMDIVCNPLNHLRPEAELNEVNELLSNLNLCDDNIKNCRNDDDASSSQIDEDFVIANGEYHCQHCPGTFKRLGNLKNHLFDKHKREMELKCSLCDGEKIKTFTDSNKYLRHMKSVHNVT